MWGALASSLLRTSCLNSCPLFFFPTCKGQQTSAKSCFYWTSAVTAPVTLEAKEMFVHHEIMNGSRGFQEKKCLSDAIHTICLKKKKILDS